MRDRPAGLVKILWKLSFRPCRVLPVHAIMMLQAKREDRAMMNNDKQRGYDKAMALTHGDTYMYDSSRRIREVAAKDADYATASDDYKGGFAAAIYALFRC